ncbi:toxin VasX, partial [Pseudomonas sp. Irchel s3h17]|uniref:toxin VasX n=1 Tax=Pseudomonas sp. Irchel s3h17 TaxID=2009182 RepID=UPI0035313646
MSEDLTEAFERIARLTYSEEGPSACVTCKRSVSILPLRYAVIGTPPASEPALPVPDLPSTLAAGNLALSTAHYTVRPLREGYLYVFVQRHASDWVCEGAYQTYDSGLCRPLCPADGDGMSYGTPMPNFGERTIQIADPEAVDAARLLFTPDLLTPRMLAEIRSQKRLRDTLRHLDIRQLI